MSDRQSIIAKTAEEMHWWKTIQIDVTEKIEHSADSLAKLGDSPNAKQTDYHYTETAAGERRLSTVMTLDDGTSHRREQVFDGRKGVTVEHDKDRPEKPKTARIGKSFGREGSISGTERPVPLKYYYVAKMPLYQALEKARDLGETEIDGKPCDRFVFEDVAVGQMRQNVLYYLRRDDALPIRIEYYDGPDPAAAHKSGIWEAEKVDVVQGRPFVVKSTMTRFNPDGSVMRSWHSEVKKVTFNEKIGMETFRPVLPPDVQVHDTITGKVHVPPGKAADEAPKAPVVAESVGVAERPVGWSPLAVNASLGLGALLLVTGVVLKLRR